MVILESARAISFFRWCSAWKTVRKIEGGGILKEGNKGKMGKGKSTRRAWNESEWRKSNSGELE